MLQRLGELIAVALMLLAGSLAVAQEPTKQEMQPPVTDSATMGKMTGEATPPPAKNDVAPPIETRKGPVTCDVAIGNTTSWIIHRVYIDNIYWGAVGPYGGAIAHNIGIGRTKFYAEADFVDGSTRHWGPRWFDCQSYSTYTWTIQ
jgi:hypothetical protein